MGAGALRHGEELQVDFAPTHVAGTPPAPEAQEAAPAPLVPGAEPPPAVPADLQAYLDQQEREILVKALRESGFNRTAAAQRLGLSLRQIRYRIARLAISAPGGDEPQDERA
jgi:two-component system response regulator PilR (NtrC family)